MNRWVEKLQLHPMLRQAQHEAHGKPMRNLVLSLSKDEAIR